MNRISFLNRGYAFKGLLAVFNSLREALLSDYLIPAYNFQETSYASR